MMNTVSRVGLDLKFYILANGIAVDADANDAWLERYGGPLSLREYASTSGICLRIGDIYINAPYTEEFTHKSEAHLRFDGQFVVTRGSVAEPAAVIPVPAYHGTTYNDGGRRYPYTDLGVTHTDRCRISPIAGCAWRCKFCDLPYEQKYRRKPKEELLRVIEIAKDDPLAPARHVLISGGTPLARDESWIDEVYAYIAGNSPIPVDVMMPARKDIEYPTWLKSVGVNMVSINLEVSDAAQARAITPSKAKIYGRQYYLDYIERSVDAFGVGFVQSLMVFGSSVEPIESTLDGVRALVDRGCIPVLSPFRPDATTPMGSLPPADEGEMRRVHEATLEICAISRTGLKPGPRCVPCHHNTVAFPDGSPFYLDQDDDLNGTWTAA